MTAHHSDSEWRRLDRRILAVATLAMAGVTLATCTPIAVGIAKNESLGAALARVLPVAAMLIAGSAVVEQARWATTRYRVSSDRVELRTGLLVRKRRSVHRDRIRSVDITADPLSRLLGLAHVKIGSGEQASYGAGSIVLRSVAKEVAEELRRELLDRAAKPSTSNEPLAQLDPAWIRYAPLSFLTPLLGAGVYGVVLNVAEWFRMRGQVIDWVLALFHDVSPLAALLVLVAVALALGVIGSLGLFVEMWWRFRLEREPGGTLRVRRGLFTSRSISLEEKRLRGVELVEPLGARLAGAARVDAIATGITTKPEKGKTNHKTLLPAAPRGVAQRVAARVLGVAESPTASARLVRHPVAARGRRLRWALAAVAIVEGVLALLGALFTELPLLITLAGALPLIPVALLLAVDAYRGLGHGATSEYLVIRAGTARRTTVTLQRSGIIGWTLKQSFFQRRAGLLTLTATTAAGAGGYSIRDADVAEGLAFAKAVSPELLAPFLLGYDSDIAKASEGHTDAETTST